MLLVLAALAVTVAVRWLLIAAFNAMLTGLTVPVLYWLAAELTASVMGAWWRQWSAARR